MSVITCSHGAVETLSTTGFGGDVSVHPYTDSNPAAHGNITVCVECTSCGARRKENINGRHIEVSPWRGSYAERAAAVIRARAEAQRTRPEPITMTRISDGETATVAIDAEGQLKIDAPTFAAQKAILGALPAQFSKVYQTHKRAVAALRDAEAEVGK